MFEAQALQIELHRGGKVTSLELQASRALVGSGAHCDLRLAPDEAAIEQLTLEARDDEVYAIVRALEPPCRLNGAPFLEGRLSPDALLEVGTVALRVTRTALLDAGKPQKKPGSQTPPLVQGLALVGLAVAFYYVLDAPAEQTSVLSASVDPPALFAKDRATCPHDDLAAASALAEQESADADSKAERSPFYASDGLSAVALYERAAACYLRASETDAAKEARLRASTLRQQLSDELHVRHVRLERFLAQRKYDAVHREVRLVSELIRDKGDPYAHWLSAVEREVQLRISSKVGG